MQRPENSSLFRCFLAWRVAGYICMSLLANLALLFVYSFCLEIISENAGVIKDQTGEIVLGK